VRDHHVHSRRDFFTRVFGGILAGASLIEEAFLRATCRPGRARNCSPSRKSMMVSMLR
jgi:hypothetical protein